MNGLYEPSRKERRFVRVYKSVLAILLLTLVAVAFLLTGCQSARHVIPGPVQLRTDTVIMTKYQRDSIWQHDSIYLHEYQKGDTIFVESRKWLVKYVDRCKTDTLYVHRTDSVPVPYPVEVEVPAQLTWWQQFRLHIANILIYFGVFWLILWLVKLFIKLRK